MIFLRSNLISYKKNIKKFHIFSRVNPYFNVSRFFYSELVNTLQCLAIIKSKKSKLYNCRCPNKVKGGDYCGSHNKHIKVSKIVKKNKLFMPEIEVKRKCLGVIKSGLGCNRMVLNNYCFQHQKNNDSICLIHGDCFTVLKKKKINTIDAIISDLPYNISNNFWDVELDLKEI